MQIKLEAVAGSASNAAKVFSMVKQMSMTTGLSPEDLTSTATGLMAAGYGMDKINEKLQQMSMFAVVSGKDVNEISGAFIRMRSLGYAQTRILGKMAKEGIPLIDSFKKFYNLSDAGWNKLAGKKIDFKLMEPVLESMTKKGSDFYNAYQKMLLTSGTSMERIHNATRVLSADFGEAFMKVFKVNDKLKDLSDNMDELEPKFENWLAANDGLLKMGGYIVAIGAALSVAAKAIGACDLALAAITQNPAAIATLTALVLAAQAYTAVKNVPWASIPGEAKEYAHMATSGRWKEAQGMVRNGMQSGLEDLKINNVANTILGGGSTSHTHYIEIGAPSSIDLRADLGDGKQYIGKSTFSANLGASTVGA
jgi:hypothetical protein